MCDAPSGKDLVNEDAVWKDVPGAVTTFDAPVNSSLVLGFSAESRISKGVGSLMVRALVDGVAIEPSDVTFNRDNARQCRTMTFGLGNVAPGFHTAKVQWLVTNGARGVLGDRSIVASVYPSSSSFGHHFVAAPSGPLESTNSNVFVPIPDLEMVIEVPENGELGVTVSGEVYAEAATKLSIRLVVDGQAVAVEPVYTQYDDAIGVQSFAFDRKHVYFDGGVGMAMVRAEWKVNAGTAKIGDRTMAVVVESGDIPDLAEAPEIGYGDGPLEPVIGSRKLMAILWNPDRPAPHHNIPTALEVEEALFGAHSVRDFFEVNSEGRFTLTNEGVFGWYDSLKDWDHYWNHDDCVDEYVGGHQEKWAEAIDHADASVDFASYDDNNDGVVSPSELGILIIIPQDDDFGTERDLAPYCSGDPFVVDGVEIPQIVEWYTSFPSFFSTAAHELSHLFFDTGDMYVKDYSFVTEAGTASLMGDNTGNTSHFDAMHKLALGWITPRVVQGSGIYTLDEVKTSGEILILPRRFSGDGQEFFLLENRYSNVVDPLYDENTLVDGIVVWHVVLDSGENAQAPNCMSQNAWDTRVSGNTRRGIRVVRPGLVFSNAGAAWNASEYDLLDIGLACPPGGPTNVLTWADGTPSGYNILAWSPEGPSMSFFIDVP